MLTTDYAHDGTATVTDDTMPGVRFITWQDTDSEDPRTWHDPSDTQTMVYATSYRGSTDSADDAHTGTMQAFQRIYDATGDDSLALKIARRYARVFEPTHAIDTYSARGHSQSDWWDVVTVTRAEYGAPESFSADWEQYARGDVYGVLVEYATVCDKGMTHWDTVAPNGVDAIAAGGIYADDAEDAVSHYLELENVETSA